MSSGKRQQKKRQRQSSPPPPSSFKAHLAQRLQRIRSGQRDLWADDDDNNNNTHHRHKQTKTTNNKKTYIVLSDSDDERLSLPLQRRLRSSKSGKKLSRNHDENVNKNTTCLICSILSQLSSYNCCSEHLSILKNHSDHQQQQQTTNSQWLPDKVMIVPVTDEIVQRYLDPQQIHNLRTQTSITNKKNSTSTSKSLNKSTMTLDLSPIEQSGRNIPKSSIQSTQMDIEPLASTIVIESVCSKLTTIQPNLITTTVTTTNNIENSTNIDNELLEKSPIEMIIIDDTPTDNQEEHTTKIKSTNNNKQMNPWSPISDEVDAALEHVLNQISSSNDIPLEFTPTTARRTDTEIMAALLPKIPLKQGRFRSGKPIINRSISNAANEYRPLSNAQSSPLPSSVINKDQPLPMTTNIEKKPSSSISCQTSNDSENLNDNRNNIPTSCILTQDEINQNDNMSITTTTIIQTNEDLHTISIINENPNTEFEQDRTNGEQNVSSSTTNERTPARITYRMNPDGTRVSISRPPLPTNRQSSCFSSLRRNSTDVTPIQTNTKQI
ncbi:unnamed protein product [Rotaria sp. Silwood1]|nr:unnamed protein product [Rotaria sp. Silwood1]